VPDYRYAQYCPLARAAEIVGERWTLLIVRELVIGPKRFSAQRLGLPGVRPSGVAERVRRHEAGGVGDRREAPPPTPATLYDLGEAGRALVPALLELVRWGARFLESPQPDEHFDPAWLRLGFQAFARTTASPAVGFEIRIEGHDALAFGVTGGPSGTSLHEATGSCDAVLRATSPLALLALASRRISAADAVRSGAVAVEGDASAAEIFPDLFDMGREQPDPNQQEK